MAIHDWTRVRAGVFHQFHQEWTVFIKRELDGGILPPGYYAMIEQSSEGRYPDVLTFEIERSPTGNGANGTAASPSSGGVLTLADAPPRVAITASIESDVYAQKSNRIVVRDDADEVVAVIEVVSPGNKSSRHALQTFVQKALEFIRLGIHLLVVDLFPPTSRDPQGLHAAIWSEMIEYDFHLPDGKPLILASYSSGIVKQAFVEVVGVGDSLPNMPLFLDPDRYVLAPLATAYQIAFDGLPKRWREVLAE